LGSNRAGHQVDVWTADLDHVADVGEGVVSEDERARARRFRHAVDRERYVACRALLRRLLADRLDVSPGSIGLAVGPHGKPYVAYPPARLEFNVTHSRHLALVALSPTLPVGIDVERIDPELDWRPLSRRFFAADEHRAIELLADEDRRAGFFACWTRKEAVVKAMGAGLSYPLDDFEVTVDPRAAPELLGRGPTMEADDWALRDLDAGEGFRACLAAPGPISVRARTVC
jgi:4'-phosphopantetheinyl transferase